MTTEQKIIRAKVGVLELAKQPVNVTAARASSQRGPGTPIPDFPLLPTG
jgi:hypothetical protein